MRYACRIDLKPRHLLHAGAPAVEKDARGADVHQDRRAAAERVRVRRSGSEKTNLHRKIPPTTQLQRLEWWSTRVVDSNRPALQHSNPPSLQLFYILLQPAQHRS